MYVYNTVPLRGDTVHWMTFHINIGLYKLLVIIAINLFKLIVCLYVSDWYLLGVKFHLSHTQIGTFYGFI